MDRHVGQPQAAARGPASHARIDIVAVHRREMWGQGRQELAVAAAHVERRAALRREIRQDPAVEVVVVAPWMPGVQPRHPTRELAARERPRPFPQSHDQHSAEPHQRTPHHDGNGEGVGRVRRQ
jgi:hypothetical protein